MDDRRKRERVLVTGLLMVFLVGLVWALNPAERPETDIVALESPSASPTGAQPESASAPTPSGSGPRAGPESPTDGILAAPLPPDQTTVQVLDAGGGGQRVRSAVAALERLGYQVVATASARQNVERTAVWFTSGKSAEAEALRARDRRFAEVTPNRGLAAGVDLHVLIGPDWA